MQIQFSYCLDAGGNLIKLSLGRHPDALITDSDELVSSAEDLAYPKPWTKTVADAINDVRFVPAAMVVGTHAEQIHTKGSLPHSPFIFVEPVEATAKDEEIIQMIDLYEDLPEEHEGRIKIEAALKSVGIVQIPVLPTHSPALHEPTQATKIAGYSSQGWISHKRVYRKATVATVV